MHFVTAVVFNIGCMAISLVLSPANRLRLSRAMGALSVVCSLSELHTPPDRVVGAIGSAGEAGSLRSRSSAVTISSADSELGHALADVADHPSSPDAARIALPT